MSADASGPSADDKARYEAAKKELAQAIGKKRLVDRQLAALETQIYKLEGSYLTDTAAHNGGNIIHGFENYLKTQTNKKKYELSEADRLFSTSSLSYLKLMELLGEGEESGDPTGDEYKQSNSGMTTVVLQPAPRPPDLTPAQAKKQRDREYQRKKRATNANRRSAGTLSDDESVATTTTGRRPTKRARMMTEEE